LGISHEDGARFRASENIDPKSGSCGRTKPGSSLGSTGCEKSGYYQKGELRRSWKLPAAKAVLDSVGDELPDLG